MDNIYHYRTNGNKEYFVSNEYEIFKRRVDSSGTRWLKRKKSGKWARLFADGYLHRRLESLYRRENQYSA